MIRIVKLDGKYLDKAYEIEQESFSIPWSKEEFTREILENDMAVYIAAVNENDEPVGYAGMWHIVTEGHITNIAVKEESRRRGIGDLLLKELIKIAREKEMIGITLEVRVHNLSAQKLYTRNGFLAEGFRKNYYADTKEDAIIMWRYFN